LEIMERALINSGHLRELQEIAQEQGLDHFVENMRKSLERAWEQFLARKIEASMIAEKCDGLMTDLHQLKNQFSNLGCEEVSDLIEDLHQCLRIQDFEKYVRLQPSLVGKAIETLQLLKQEIPD